MTEICNIQDEIKKALPYIKERWIMPNEELNRDTNFIYKTNKFEKYPFKLLIKSLSSL